MQLDTVTKQALSLWVLLLELGQFKWVTKVRFRQTALFEVNVREVWIDQFLEEYWLGEGTRFTLGKWCLSFIHQLHKHLRWPSICIPLHRLEDAILLIFLGQFAKGLVRCWKLSTSLLHLHLLDRLAEWLYLLGHLEGWHGLRLVHELIVDKLRLGLRLVKWLVNKWLPLWLLEFLSDCFKYACRDHSLHRLSFLVNFFFTR